MYLYKNLTKNKDLVHK